MLTFAREWRENKKNIRITDYHYEIKHKKDKSGNNVIGYLQGAEENRWKWLSSEHTFFYRFDFWKYANMSHIQK